MLDIVANGVLTAKNEIAIIMALSCPETDWILMELEDSHVVAAAPEDAMRTAKVALILETQPQSL